LESFAWFFRLTATIANGDPRSNPCKLLSRLVVLGRDRIHALGFPEECIVNKDVLDKISLQP